MAIKPQPTSIEGRTIKLSNLSKIFFPSIPITKAEFIKYYLDISDLLLRYIKGRALTLIRYPDGVQGKRFYSKEKPAWTPDWIPSYTIQHQEKEIHYIVAEEKATIVWLANLACVEIHPMQFTIDSEYKPDYFVIDLDPDEALDFELVKEAAQILNVFLKRYDYTPFVKTSGGKGLHLIIPIQPRYDFETMLHTVTSLTKIFITQHPNLYTLAIKKEKRKGKILIDIYRNHMSNTTIAPFSLRGKKGAPVSMPFYWEDIDDIISSQQFNIHNYRDFLDKKGDAWEKWKNYATLLHDQKIMITQASKGDDTRLKSYLEKRNFKNTPEPLPKINLLFKDHYVIQLHDAQNLHYDLRLEDKGVLLSWAIPKGLPYQRKVKRLAIRTEDHPIKYLDFEGIIPKGQYGAGKMWIYDKGKIKWNKKSNNHYQFELGGGKAYNLFHTKDEQWLIEYRGEEKDSNHWKNIKHMLAGSHDTIPEAKDLIYEVKWDGIRVFVVMVNGKVQVISRGGRDITHQFPELQEKLNSNVESFIIDAEIVVLDKEGVPVFSEIISRMHTIGEKAIKALTRNKPAICYAFDLVLLDGTWIDQKPLQKRREWMEIILNWNTSYRYSQSFPDGKALFAAIKEKNMEGVMAKKKNSKYVFGERSKHWLKIKVRNSDTVYVIGYTKGKGDRSSLFGALHLAKKEKNTWKYMGKVGTGFNMQKMKRIWKTLSNTDSSPKLVKDKIENEKDTTWITPKWRCEVQYASITSTGTYREPVFLGLRSDLLETLE